MSKITRLAENDRWKSGESISTGSSQDGAIIHAMPT